MNKQLSQKEIDACLSPVVAKMTRHEKLLRLAKAVRSQENGVYIFHRIEDMTSAELAGCFHPYSAFQIALVDPALRQAGLKPDFGSVVSVRQGQRFFELSKDDLHAFSCDCGGLLTNDTMATRIERIAGPDPTTPKSLLSRVIDSKEAWTG